MSRDYDGVGYGGVGYGGVGYVHHNKHSLDINLNILFHLKHKIEPQGYARVSTIVLKPASKEGGIEAEALGWRYKRGVRPGHDFYMGVRGGH